MLVFLNYAKVGCDISDIKLSFDTNTAIGQESARRISVGFFGSVREAASVNEQDLLISCEKTVYSFIIELAEKFGETFAKEIFCADNPEVLREDVMLTLNRKILHHSKADKTILKDKDTLEIFPIFPGGG